MKVYIKNRSQFPAAVKKAALRASQTKRNSKRTMKAVAEDFNISVSTLHLWRRTAGVSAAQPKGLADYQAIVAKVKKFNTPEVVCATNSTTVLSIQYQGRTFTAR